MRATALTAKTREVIGQPSHRPDVLARNPAERYRHLRGHHQPRVAGLVVGDAVRDPLGELDEGSQAVDGRVPLQHVVAEAGLGVRSVPAVSTQELTGTLTGG